MIRYLKLISGVELIGEVISDTGIEITMRTPMRIEMIDHGGHYACGLVTYCIGADVVTFNGRYVIQQGEASEQFQETYGRRKGLASAVFETDGPAEMPLYEGVGPDELIEDDEPEDDDFEEIQPQMKRTLH